MGETGNPEDIGLIGTPVELGLGGMSPPGEERRPGDVGRPSDGAGLGLSEAVISLPLPLSLPFLSFFRKLFFFFPKSLEGRRDGEPRSLFVID
jgi:hypothetical protein